MDEVLFYISQGDKNEESYGYITSIHSSKQYASLRQASTLKHSTKLTGFGPGERIITSCIQKSLIHVYSYGKESIDQKIPIPESLTSLCIVSQKSSKEMLKLPNFRLPWLLIGGSKSGKLYIWELASGNLLNVKDAHYQGINVIKVSCCGNFLITGGEDARVIVWNLFDSINCFDQAQIKPYWSITDNTLPITDLILNDTGIISDLKLYTVSKDNTLRIYDIITKSLLTTFILPDSIESVCKDPANRVLYVGLSSGLIRPVPLYHINPYNSTLESIGGNNKIITLENDPDLKNPFVHHQGNSVTYLILSLDGTCLLSGDSKGQVYASDVITKQVIKQFQPCNGPISYMETATIPTDIKSIPLNKKHRMIPQLKRVLIGTDPIEHNITLDIPEKLTNDDEDFCFWLNEKKLEELEFKNSFGDVNSTVKSSDSDAKLQKVSNAYNDLRSKYEELIKEHSKLLDKLE
ncbi:unnamed protein product [Candida verbasci]|uniref:Pre-rRNA-processing protein IPI3 n=1 Tax=Candida verbasci TaxID=1227364 RepID=A0A9W4TXD0_9ASCO|nr:unnamed protein product [Candida verbasci]